MFIYQSNQMEILLHQLRNILQSRLPDPLIPEIIVVQHQGMAQWVRQQLAFADGIAANFQFPLPARLAWDLFQRLAAAPQEEDLFCRPVLRWRLAELLPSLLHHRAFGELANYLLDDLDGGKLYQLCGRISDVFDQYLVYRPEMLHRWQEGQEGQEEHWQAVLWQSLTAGRSPHRARLGELFRQAFDSATDISGTLASRYHFFGLNSLAPVYFELFARISSRTEVHFYHLSPCRQYWGDLVSARQQASTRGRRQDTVNDAYTDQGHPLLASLGRAGQDFFRQLLELESVHESDLYQDDSQEHLLAVLHNDILDLNDRSIGEAERFLLRSDDRSVQFHNCSSVLREVQVLHDRLLDMMQQHPDLSPGDILVSAPDIHLYAEAIAGVFGEANQQRHKQRHIPWSMADQSFAGEQPLIRCFLGLLDLFTSRFTAPEVLALCETPALLRRFGLDPSVLPCLHTWVREAGICWGLDESHRQDLGIEAGVLHSWRFGLDRLVLGSLMGNCNEPQAGILPYPGLDASEAEDLGSFATLIDTLADWRRRLSQARPAAAWSEALIDLLSAVFVPADADEQAMQILHEAIIRLQTDCQLAGHWADLTCAVVKAHLASALKQVGYEQGFLGGRVSFCNLVPMRSVPFRVICLLGMNEQAFPRYQQPIAFDLIATEPRLGDRNRRQDDRYLFLETLLSARDILYLSWIGRNLRDDSISTPSALISEMHEYLDQSCSLPETTQIAAHLTTVHPMQPFSRRCFEGNAAIASYNPAWLPAAQEATAPPFFGTPLPEPAEAWRLVSLSRLVQFWQHPCRFLLEQILGMRLFDVAEEMQESEPFALDALQTYQLRRETIANLVTGLSPEQIGHGFATGGRLPQGSFGSLCFQTIAQQSLPFADEVRPLLAQPLPPVVIDQGIGPFRLIGWLSDCYPSGRITWRAGTLKGRDLVALWLPHLVLNLLAPEGLPLRSLHLAWDSAGAKNPVDRIVMQPVQNPERHLRWLLDRYWLGLSQPLRFFSETSLAWARAVQDGKDSLQAAQRAWDDGYRFDGEGRDFANRLCFQQESLECTQEFIDLSQLFATILQHMETDHAAA